MKISFDAITLHALYYEYKEQIIYGLIILVCIVLGIFFVTPLVLDFFSVQKEEALNSAKNDVLRANIDFINLLDADTLGSDLDASVLAVGIQKDYVGVLNTISQAADGAGVSVGDFSFRVGDVSTDSAKITTSALFTLNISIKADIDTLKLFVDNLYKQLPLADIGVISFSGKSASITVNFPYRSYKKPGVLTDKKLTPLGVSQKATLATLHTWFKNTQTFSNLGDEEVVVASGSAFANTKKITSPVSTPSAGLSASKSATIR